MDVFLPSVAHIALPGRILEAGEVDAIPLGVRQTQEDVLLGFRDGASGVDKLLKDRLGLVADNLTADLSRARIFGCGHGWLLVVLRGVAQFGKGGFAEPATELQSNLKAGPVGGLG